MDQTLRRDADTIIRASIQAVQPDAAVRRALEHYHPGRGRTLLVAAGKAAWQMASAAVQALGQAPESVRETLMVLIGRATEVFERLPLEKDLGLMRNILYAGVWQQYNSRRAGQEEREQA